MALTKNQKMDAYQAVRDFFTLTRQQRTALDTCASYEQIMEAGHRDDMLAVARLLSREDVVSDDYLRAALMEDF